MRITISTLLILLTNIVYSQTNKDILQKIQKVSADSSHIMQNISVLSDVYGPRFLGTPNYYNSVLWLEKELKKAGIKTEKQSFDKKNRGWTLESFSIEMSSPSYAHINAYPLAYTNSTNGIKEGEVITIKRFDELYKKKGTLQNKIVLLQGYYRPNSSLKRNPTSFLSDEILTKASANQDPNDLIIGYHSRRPTTDVFEFREQTKKERTIFFNFCKKEGILAIIEPSNSPYGIIHADGNRSTPSFSKQNDIKAIPSFAMSNEHFGRLIRLVNMGYSPRLKFNLKTTFYSDPKFNVNLIAEIPGTDKDLKDEIVIIGAHLDSWHAGTGAVDNAANCAVMIEAIRLIKAANLKPKRTIKLILWGGEEQVFAGSYNYVNKHVGDMKTFETKSENKRISAYLNLDNGAGKIRGIYLMGNQKIVPFFAEYLQPFEESQTLTIQNANQTDHELFDFHNVPAFQFIQDPLDYIPITHHTNMDVYEYIPEKAQKYNAKLVAYLTYQIAQEPTLLPRKKFNSPIPSKKGNTTFNLEGFPNAKKVSLVGDFNNWNMFGTPLYKTKTGWKVKIDLPKGKYYYKFIVDGYWTADPKTHEEKLAKDGKGHGGLTILRVN